jgi:hypothetical protein
VNGARVVGREALARVWAPSFARGGAPFDIEDTIVSGDRVVQLWRFTDGDRVVRGVDVLRVRGGLLAEKFGYVKA